MVVRAYLMRLFTVSASAGKAVPAVAIVSGVMLPPAVHALRGIVPVAVVGLSTLVLLRVDVPATLAAHELRCPDPTCLFVEA